MVMKLTHQDTWKHTHIKHTHTRARAHACTPHKHAHTQHTCTHNTHTNNITIYFSDTTGQSVEVWHSVLMKVFLVKYSMWILIWLFMWKMKMLEFHLVKLKCSLEFLLELHAQHDNERGSYFFVFLFSLMDVENESQSNCCREDLPCTHTLRIYDNDTFTKVDCIGRVCVQSHGIMIGCNVILLVAIKYTQMYQQKDFLKSTSIGQYWCKLTRECYI